jgi:predicted short-subunit dehydrogenase-like oxidoreductase (DUF2520 family)
MTPQGTLSPDQAIIGFIGAGRLGRALAWSLEQSGWPVSAVASRTNASARALAAPLRHCDILTAQAVADACDLVFITTPDSAIEPTAQSLRWKRGMYVVHCSGATEVTALQTAADAGASTGGFHPMQTFSDIAVAMRTLPGCTITVEAQGMLNLLLFRLAAALGCKVNHLPPGMRGRYHAAGGYASQFVNVLLKEAVQIWQSWGASEEQALQALLPLLKGTASAIERSGLERGMPGPVSRGDVQTVARHVQALQQMGADPVALYRALCRRSVAIAQEAGRITAPVAAEFLEELEPPRA